MKHSVLCALLALGLVAARPALAQGGCDDDSPENPTLILAGLAGGVYAVNAVRLRIRARRNPDQE